MKGKRRASKRKRSQKILKMIHLDAAGIDIGSRACKVAVIDGGRIIAEGTPEELWHRSSTDRIGELIGLNNRLKGAVEVSTNEPTNGTVRRSSFRSGRYQVEVDLDAGSSVVAVSDQRLEAGTRVGITSERSPLKTED